ncbi:hypothetical protein M0R45_034686 [Rubus argutus]|uniref:Uncharacterized protein n=1 Tax=Rubus argutus TaxID=59490 RepID=A0AAW1VUJ6_RUBAR
MASVIASQALLSPNSTLIRATPKFKSFYIPTPSVKFLLKSPTPLHLRHHNPQTITQPNLRSHHHCSPMPQTCILTILFALSLADARTISIPLLKFGSQFGPSIASTADPLFFPVSLDSGRRPWLPAAIE